LIRKIEDGDIDAILAIQSLCPEIAQWTVWDYARVARGEMTGWVADDGIVVGFLIARRIVRDIEILNFAVGPDLRKRGIGTALLREVFVWGKTFGAENALLEVRASNLAALHFYEQHGFRTSGRRKQYYSAPTEDALELAATLK